LRPLVVSRDAVRGVKLHNDIDPIKYLSAAFVASASEAKLSEKVNGTFSFSIQLNPDKTDKSQPLVLQVAGSEVKNGDDYSYPDVPQPLVDLVARCAEEPRVYAHMASIIGRAGVSAVRFVATYKKGVCVAKDSQVTY
jgi:hypothetical protein